MAELIQYATALSGATRYPFLLRQAASNAEATSSDVTLSAGDVKVYLDDDNTGANISALPTYAGGRWKLALTTGEATAASFVLVKIANAAIQTELLYFKTFGHASASYPPVYSGGAAGNLITSGTGTDQLSVTSGKVIASSVSGTVGAALSVGGTVGAALSVSGTVGAAASVSGTVGAALSVSGTVGAAASVSGTVGAATSVSGTVGAIAGFQSNLTGSNNLATALGTLAVNASQIGGAAVQTLTSGGNTFLKVSTAFFGSNAVSFTSPSTTPDVTANLNGATVTATVDIDAIATAVAAAIQGETGIF
jgi:hypothetical protein